jgi:predicted transcriptional regulator
MRVCRVKVRVEPEDAYWKGQVQRLKEVEKSLHKGKRVRLQGTELVFANLADMAQALTPKRLDLLRLVRRHQPSSVRELAQLAGRDLKNVLADVKALETLGLVNSEGEQKERHRKPLRTDFGRIEVHVEL